MQIPQSGLQSTTFAFKKHAEKKPAAAGEGHGDENGGKVVHEHGNVCPSVHVDAEPIAALPPCSVQRWLPKKTVADKGERLEFPTAGLADAWMPLIELARSCFADDPSARPTASEATLALSTM